jgi:peptide/nickel transport system substrate-binding protein
VDNKIKFFILSTKNRIFNLFDKISGKFSRKKIKVHTLQSSLDKKLVQNLSKSSFPSFKQLRQLPQFLSVKEKTAIKILSFIVFVCAIFLGTNFYLSHIKVVPAQAGEYIEGVVGSPQFINPLFSQINDVDSDLVKLIFSGLFRYDSETGELKTDLAEKYEISEDQKIYTIYLKENLIWQNGESLTIDDVIFTVELAKYPETKSPLGTSFRGVTIEKVDDKTVKFILAQPYAPFLSVLTFGILPKHIWEEVSPANVNLAVYNLKPVGSGPYKVDSLSKNKEGDIKEYLLTANDRYHFNSPFIKNIKLKFFSGYNKAVQALKTRAIQGLSFSPTEVDENLDTKEHLNNYELVLPQHTSIFFNQEKNEFLKDINIREALTHGINKEELIKNAIDGKGKIISNPFITEPWAKDIKQDEFNQEKSRELIEKSGFEKGEEDLYYKKEITVDDDVQDQELTITITSINSMRNAILIEEIKKYWEEINIKTEISLIDSAELKKVIEEKSYEVLLYGEIIGFDPDPYPFWHSSQNKVSGLNLSGFNNEEADKLLEEARVTTDKIIREEKYKKFQEILTKEKPAIFLYQPLYSYTVDKNIKGVKIDKVVSPADRFSNVEDWYVKTKKQFFWEQ